MSLRPPPSLVARMIYAAYKPWCKSLRMTVLNRDPVNTLISAGKPVVLALWHNECFSLIHLKQQWKLMTIASQSRDGAYIAGALESLGFAVARGSSSHGGSGALLASARLMRQGYSPAITVDGPRGPRHKVKDGVLFLARITGAPIVAVRAVCERSVRFNSWDRFEVPLPFSRVRVRYGNPYTLARDALEGDGLAEERARLEGELAALETA